MSGVTAWPEHGTETLPPRDDDLVLDMHGVSKRFCRDLQKSLWYAARDMVGELFAGRAGIERLRPGEFWAVRNVSLQMRRGEAMGLVGRNGAGKTTLLRMISGIIRPDTGRVAVRGRVAPLIALGAGFKPILTGRENAFANMSILGLSRDEIHQRFESVVQFADIREAIDAPVQTYSKGMKARLGFSCAVHVDPDVFIIDEALSVGDLQFRAKCYRKLAELRERGISMLIVTHNAHMLTSICDRAAYLRRGELIEVGDPHAVVDCYKRDLDAAELGTLTEGNNPAQAFICYEPPDRPEHSSVGAEIVSVDFRGTATDQPELRSGAPARLTVRFRCYRTLSDANLFVGIKRRVEQSKILLSLHSRDDGQSTEFPPGEHELTIEMPQCCLGSGQYAMKTYLEEQKCSIVDVIDWSDLPFTVEAAYGAVNSDFYQPRTWGHRALPATFRRSA